MVNPRAEKKTVRLHVIGFVARIPKPQIALRYACMSIIPELPGRLFKHLHYHALNLLVRKGSGCR